MTLKSLGYRSQLIFTAFDGRCDDRGDHVAIHTLSNPNYFWGNLLIFDRPPKAGDYAAWIKAFHQEFTNPKIYHVTFAWESANGEVGDVSEFLEQGFLLEANTVLTAQKVIRPSKFNSDLEVRIITESEWEQMIEVQVAASDDHLSRAEWESFSRNQSRRYLAIEAAGLGHWYGGFLDGKLVAGLGIYHRDRLGRFQTVSTHPDFQRRGICQTLVYKSSLMAFDSGKIDTLVMCADPDYHAIKIYESVGFKRQLTEHGVYWWDKNREPK